MRNRLGIAAAASCLLVASLAPTLASATEPTRWRWTEISPRAGEAPAPRRNGSAIWDEPGRREVVFGGAGASGTLNDVWAARLPGSSFGSCVCRLASGPGAVSPV